MLTSGCMHDRAQNQQQDESNADKSRPRRSTLPISSGICGSWPHLRLTAACAHDGILPPYDYAASSRREAQLYVKLLSVNSLTIKCLCVLVQS